MTSRRRVRGCRDYFLVAMTTTRINVSDLLFDGKTKEERTSWNDDDNNQDDDDSNQTNAHLHVLPPHLFPYPIRTPAESLSGNSQVVGLVLQGVEAFATLGNLVDIFTHHTNGVIDLLCKPKSEHSAEAKRHRIWRGSNWCRWSEGDGSGGATYCLQGGCSLVTARGSITARAARRDVGIIRRLTLGHPDDFFWMDGTQKDSTVGRAEERASTLRNGL